MISEKVRTQVRERAEFACEYCGVSETDSGGELTIDHYQPQSHNGSDEIDNLVYCCIRCNSYKADYWPTKTNESALWNPRQEKNDKHFLLLADGQLHPFTKKGKFTIQRLRLNRLPLIAYRQRKRFGDERTRLLLQFYNALQVFEQLEQNYANLLDEQRKLLEQQQRLLNLLVSENPDENNQ
jgi:hypothetical protein